MNAPLHGKDLSSMRIDADALRSRRPSVDRSLGELIRQARSLTDAQIEQIVMHQRQHGTRFGESAVALNLASGNDVLRALSEQFHYHYAADGKTGFDDELVAAVDPFCNAAEAFRALRSQLMSGVFAADHPRRALAVLSPNVGDGKTFFVANLAVTLSQLGGRTLLVDADMRTPRLHAVFRVPNQSGLSHILAGRSEADMVYGVDQLPNLFVLPVGAAPPNPLELLQHAAFPLLIQELLSKFDYVVVDTPALEHGADARVLAAKCGAALTIGRRGRTGLRVMRELIDSLVKGPVAFAGVVMNDH